MEGEELARFPLFETLSKKEREALARYVDWIDVRAGRKLVDEGAFAHEFFLIDEGKATVTRGEETLSALGPGDFFGEIALQETERRTASVTAVTDMRLLVMHERDFRSMTAQVPAVAALVSQAIRERMPR